MKCNHGPTNIVRKCYTNKEVYIHVCLECGCTRVRTYSSLSPYAKFKDTGWSYSYKILKRVI